MKLKKLHNKGFTLIEILISVAIIGIITSVVLASLNTARAKSRDAKRVSDVKQIQLALENYFDNNGNGSFPSSINTLVSGGILPSEPKDPTTAASYFYGVSSTNNQYCVGAQLEGAANAGSMGANGSCPFTWTAPNSPAYIVVGP